MLTEVPPHHHETPKWDTTITLSSSSSSSSSAGDSSTSSSVLFSPEEANSSSSPESSFSNAGAEEDREAEEEEDEEESLLDEEEYERRECLSRAIATLPGDFVADTLEIIRMCGDVEALAEDEATDEIEIDFELLSWDTVRRLELFIERYNPRGAARLLYEQSSNPSAPAVPIELKEEKENGKENVEELPAKGLEKEAERKGKEENEKELEQNPEPEIQVISPFEKRKSENRKPLGSSIENNSLFKTPNISRKSNNVFGATNFVMENTSFETPQISHRKMSALVECTPKGNNIRKEGKETPNSICSVKQQGSPFKVLMAQTGSPLFTMRSNIRGALIGRSQQRTLKSLSPKGTPKIALTPTIRKSYGDSPNVVPAEGYYFLRVYGSAEYVVIDHIGECSVVTSRRRPSTGVFRLVHGGPGKGSAAVSLVHSECTVVVERGGTVLGLGQIWRPNQWPTFRLQLQKDGTFMILTLGSKRPCCLRTIGKNKRVVALSTGASNEVQLKLIFDQF